MDAADVEAHPGQPVEFGGEDAGQVGNGRGPAGERRIGSGKVVGHNSLVPRMPGFASNPGRTAPPSIGRRSAPPRDAALDLPAPIAQRSATVATLLPDARAAHLASADRQKASLGNALRLVTTAVLIALGLRTFVYEPFNIPSESMLPGLQVGDYLFVAKWPYGYGRLSLPLGLPLFDGRVGAALPARGDVIVFKTPRDNRTDYIKRVVGLPGDRVRMTGGQVEINGVLVPRRPATPVSVALPSSGSCPGQAVPGNGSCRYPAFAERLPNDITVATLDQVPGNVRDDTPVVTVPAGQLFVLGDNRDDSADSRFTVAEGGVGLVPVANIIGRADFIFFSVDPAAQWSNPMQWLDKLRTARIGQRL